MIDCKLACTVVHVFIIVTNWQIESTFIVLPKAGVWNRKQLSQINNFILCCTFLSSRREAYQKNTLEREKRYCRHHLSLERYKNGNFDSYLVQIPIQTNSKYYLEWNTVLSLLSTCFKFQPYFPLSSTFWLVSVDFRCRIRCIFPSRNKRGMRKLHLLGHALSSAWLVCTELFLSHEKYLLLAVHSCWLVNSSVSPNQT